MPKAPRSNPPTIGTRGEDFQADESSGEEISKEELVAWARLVEPTIDPQTPAVGPQRSHLPRESRKFHKVDREVARAEQLAAEARRASLGEDAFETDNLPAYGEEGAADLPAGAMLAQDPRKALRHMKGRRRSLGSKMMAWGIVLLLMVASFFLGRATRPVSLPAPSPAATPAPAANLPGTLLPPASPVNASPSPVAAR